MAQDNLLNVVFKELPDGTEICEVRTPGDRDMVKVFPAHDFSGWVQDGYGDQEAQTYAQRFNEQYRRFREHAAQTQDGTPLREAPFITQAKANQLKALGFYTLEQVAAAESRSLKAIGQGGRELKNKVADFLNGNEDRELVEMRHELARVKQQLAQKVEEETPASEPHPGDPKPLPEPTDEPEDDSAQREALKDEIKELTGTRPRGNPSVTTLRETLDDLKKGK